MPVSPRDLFDWHERPGAFERLVPPWEELRIVSREGGIRDGARAVIQMRAGPAWITWEALHMDYIPGEQFRDESVRGPFKQWVHTHRFEPHPEGSELVDHIDYALPMGGLGSLFGGGVASERIDAMFRFRHERTRRDMERIQSVGLAPMTVAVTGASGLVGTQLCAFLDAAGHRVLRLVRREAREGEVRWDPARGEIDAAALEGVDAVIHLAGENVGGGRWTAARKRRIRESRSKGTELLARALAGLERPPKVLLSASAVGIYGDRADEALGEESALGDTFLSEVCQLWEASADPAREAGIRVVHPRIGVVLTPSGGALGQLLPLFKAGMGGPVAGGRQWVSWVSIDDLIGAFYQIIADPSFAGPVNITAPNPVTNAGMGAAIGAALGRPAAVPTPAFALKAALGEMAAIVMESAKVLPRHLQASGFQFYDPDLEPMLRLMLGRG